MKEIERLLKLELIVTERDIKASYKKYFICKPKTNLDNQRQNNNEYGHYFISIDKSIELADAGGYLYFIDKKWVFQVWEYTPGPGIDDFVAEFNDLHSAIDAIINFYFGKPTIIQNWVFLLHRHPELNLLLIDSVINNAVKVTESEFEQISTQLWQEVKNNNSFRAWEKALVGDFLKISHVSDNSTFLMARRDLRQSYLVCV